MSESPDGNKRAHERQPIELKVEYKRLNSFFADYTKNISKGGTFIRTEKPLPEGTEFVFQLTIPSLADPLRIRGLVEWISSGEGPSDDPGMGIRFLYRDVDERQAIEEVVSNLMRESLGELVAQKLIDKSREIDES